MYAPAKLWQTGLLRTVIIVGQGLGAASPSGPPRYIDAGGNFRKIFGPDQICLLVRPDGYLAWRGLSFEEAGFGRILASTFTK